MAKTDNFPNIGTEAGNRDPDLDFRQALGEALKGHKREDLAAHLQAGGIPISVSDLNEFTRSPNDGRGKRFPACWLPALCDVLGEFKLREFALSEEQRLCLLIGTALASNGWLRKKLLELLAAMDKAEQRALRANAKRKR